MNPDEPPSDLDARVRFYLEHREQIETWHRLRPDAIRWCRDALDALVPALAVLAESHDLELRDARTGKWRILSVAPAAIAMADDGTPLAAVAVSWADEVVPDDPDLAPWVGVRAAIGDARGSAVREVVATAVRSERSSRGALGDRWWPIWQRVVAPFGWWDDPSNYLESIRATVEDYVTSFSTIATDAASKTLDR